MPAPAFTLSALPFPVLERLLHGASGRFHLEQTARLALQHAMENGALRQDDAGVELAILGASLLAMAWEFDPLDGALARNALTAAAMVPELPIPKEAMVAAVHHYETPAGTSSLRQAQMDGDLDQVRQHCDMGLLEAPGSSFWMREAAALAVYRGELEWLEGLLGRFIEHAPRPLTWAALRLGGDVHLFSQSFDEAKSLYAKAASQAQAQGGGESALSQLRLAEAFWRQGRADRAVSLWQQTCNAKPWLTSHLLSIHDRLTGVDEQTVTPEGKIAVCFYSYNKSKDLDAAIRSVSESRLHGASIIVLDNGSTDATTGMLAVWRARLKDRLTTVRLPVNIGAPAARNWLLAMEEVKSCEHVVFLDDDATVPEDWLERLFAARAAYPKAGVWGCKVVDAETPWRIQSADFQLTEPPPMSEPGGFAPAYPKRIRLSGVHHEDMDAGQHDYLRPCASVTGCCHLFSREVLKEVGGFDLRFNPTQYDDLEHDLRLCLLGRFPVYQGRLAVSHKKASGKSAQKEQRASASSLGNLYKLEMDFDGEAITQLRERNVAVLLRDLQEKAGALVPFGMRGVAAAWRHV